MNLNLTRQPNLTIRNQLEPPALKSTSGLAGQNLVMVVIRGSEPRWHVLSAMEP